MNDTGVGDTGVGRSVYFAAFAGLTGMAISNRIAELINPSPDFYGLYRMDNTSILSFQIILYLVFPLAFGAILASLSRYRAMRIPLMGFFVILTSVTLVGTLRDLPDPSHGWLIIVAAVLLSILAYYTFLKFPVVRIFFVATALSLPLTLYNSIVTAGLLSGDSKITASGSESTTVDTGTKRPNIVFLVFDELPITTLMDKNGQIDRHRFPNFYELTKKATWFRGASSVSCNTPTAVPAILSGQLFGNPNPVSKRPTNKSYPTNVFTALKSKYRIYGVESLTQLCPYQICGRKTVPWYRNEYLFEHLFAAWSHASLPVAMDKYLTNLDVYWMEAVARQNEKQSRNHNKLYSARVSQFNNFVESITPGGDKPWAYIGHFLIPHTPFETLSDGSSYFRGLTTYGIEGKAWTNQKEHVRQSYYRHILQSMFVDKLVGKLIKHLKEIDQYGNTVIVITADHGVSFVPGDTRRITNKNNYPNLIGVPLIMKSPGQVDGRIIDSPTQTIDILPTLLGMVDIDFDKSSFAGRDVFSKNLVSLKRRIHYCSRSKYKYYDLDLLQKELDEIATKDKLFGDREDGNLAMNFAARPDWIGRRVNDIGTITITNKKARIVISNKNTSHNSRTLNVKYDFVPLYLNGVLTDGGGKMSDELLYVAALNSRIASVMPPVQVGNTREGVISLMLNPEYLRDGINVVDLYVLDKEDESSAEFQKLTIVDYYTGETHNDLKFEHCVRNCKYVLKQ